MICSFRKSNTNICFFKCLSFNLIKKTNFSLRFLNTCYHDHFKAFIYAMFWYSSLTNNQQWTLVWKTLCCTNVFDCLNYQKSNESSRSSWIFFSSIKTLIWTPLLVIIQKSQYKSVFHQLLANDVSMDSTILT